MLNGLQVLDSIDHTLGRAQREAEVVDHEITLLTERLMHLREDAGAAYQTLARLRLDESGRNGLIQELSAADQRLKTLLAERHTLLGQVESSLTALRQELDQWSSRRALAAERLEQRGRALATAEAAVRAALSETEGYRLQRALSEKAEQIARFAEQKTALADKDRLVKGAPYEADPLFMYLWRRRYGTGDYRANPLSRFCDARVARLCAFEQARANYAMLLEIPRRLGEHAARQKAGFAQEAERLRALERAALDQGECAVLRKARDQTRAELDGLEDRIESIESNTAVLIERKSALNRGDDEVSRQAVAAIESALRREDLKDLREAAIGTPFDEDDAAVRRLEAIEEEREDVEEALDTQKAIRRAQRERLAELDNVRREYRHGQYRNDNWDFRSGDMLGVLLGEVLRGSMTRDVFWDSMRQHQRPGSEGSFGWPGTGGSGSGGDSDGFGDGDFRSGGSF